MDLDNMDLYDTTDENTKARQKDDKKEVEKEEKSNKESNGDSAPNLRRYRKAFY